MTRTFHCVLVGGPFDGDAGWVRDDSGDEKPPESIWAGHCKPISRCREIHWTLDRVRGVSLGYERYGYDHTVDNPVGKRPARQVHVYVCADMLTGPEVWLGEGVLAYG